MHRHVLVECLELLLLRGCRIPAVIESRAISCPVQCRELEPFKTILEDFAGVDIQNPARSPVRAPILDEIGNMCSIRAGVGGRQRNRAIIRPGVRIDEQLSLGIKRCLHENDVLVLQTIVIVIEVAVTFFCRQTESLVVPQFRHAIRNQCSLRNRRQVGESNVVLCGHPVSDILALANIILQPTERIRHFGAMIVVDMIHCRGLRVIDCCGFLLRSRAAG